MIGAGEVVEFGWRNLMVVVVELESEDAEDVVGGKEMVQALRSRERCLRRISTSWELRGWDIERTPAKLVVNVSRL